MKKKQKWDWFKVLRRAIEHAPDTELQGRMKDKASDWPTCACGQLCKRLPRHANKEPKDSALGYLGMDFFGAVCRGYYHEAMSLMKSIEARTTKLLNKT
jgi:hypothetical protein